MQYVAAVGYWTGRRTLVTGAGGFIGGHLVVALLRAGAEVRALCRYNSRGERGTLDWFAPADIEGVEVEFGDLRDPDSVAAAMSGEEVVFHLGAQIAIPHSLRSPRDFFVTNVEGTLNVAQAALRSEVVRLVHVSTSEVYGEPSGWPITEGFPPAPRSPYAASKAGADMLLAAFHASFGLPVAVARPFNTYGPHQSARAIVPTIGVQALVGTEVVLGSLDPRRDLTFVSDTVAGLMAIAACDAAVGQTLQLGTGVDVSVAELVELIAELTGRSLQAQLDPDRVRPPSSEVSRLVSDHSRVTALTGWEPRQTLREGLSLTLDWLGQNLDRYRPGVYQR
jgi:nucleoside-diphosphate-sugar epimerase